MYDLEPNLNLFLPVNIPLLSLLFAPYFVWDFKRTFTMGLVEEIYTPAGIENDELGTEAANANFDKDRETNPIKSNPKLSNNQEGRCLSDFPVH